MSVSIVDVEAEHAALNAFLDARIYEFNVRASGARDGKLFSGAVRGDAGEILAGVSGHTWGGTCQITYLWVHEQHRHRGLGTQLMQAVEDEARRRGCSQISLGTHSFQAPLFYERLGFVRVAEVRDYPKGHAQLTYLKALGVSAAERP